MKTGPGDRVLTQALRRTGLWAPSICPSRKHPQYPVVFIRLGCLLRTQHVTGTCLAFEELDNRMQDRLVIGMTS